MREYRDAVANWGAAAYDETGPVAGYAPRRSLANRLFTGRPLVVLLAAGLILATVLVLVTRVPAASAPSAAPAVADEEVDPQFIGMH